VSETTISESIEINATPEAVFAVISDLVQMGRFSLENRGGRWVGGATGPARGARFKGRNGQGRSSWSTIATVVTCDAPHEFSFAVTYFGIKVSRWTYQVTPRDGGVNLRQTWRDERPGWFAVVTKPLVSDRVAFTRDSIHHTLTSMKAFLEA